MKIRIAVATYGRLEQIISNVSFKMIPSNVELIRMNSVLNELSSEARRLEHDHLVDAFVASGGNASILKSVVSNIPIVQIVPKGIDVLEALKAASLRSKRIGCIFFEDSMTEAVQTLTELKHLVDLDLDMRFYSTRRQLESIIADMKADGITDIIGGSLALQVAAEKGIYGHYILSENGIVSAVNTAAELVISRNAEAIKSQQFSNVLDFISEGILATNQDDCVTICNPSAEKIFGIKSSEVIGKKITDVLKNTRLNVVRRTCEMELNQIQHEGNVSVITNRVPMVYDGRTIGALATFKNIYDVERAEAQIKNKLYLHGLVAKHSFSDIIYCSREMEQLISDAKQYSQSDATLLITGDSGTGKELLAQSIHNSSRRKNAPFVAINCAAVSSQLLESELFGYEEGAFTGAKKGGKRGIFELADSGTVFLDEIAEISMETQAHLLRVIEQREVMRVGGEKIRPIDIRIITATNKDLWKMVQMEQFRKDLYYRLNILSLKIPPLSQRPDDIPVLFRHYLREYCPQLSDGEIERLAHLPMLTKYSWHGNIRELRNVAEHLSVLYGTRSDYEQIIMESLHPDNSIQAPPYLPNEMIGEADIDREKLIKTLSDCGGNKTSAAELLGVSRSTLWRWMKKAGLN